MDGFEKLHAEQDEFIKKTLQADKIVSQPVFENFSAYMETSNIKVKRYSYKQQKIIIILLVLLLISVGLNIYLFVVKPASITNLFESFKANENQKVEEITENKIVENIVNNTVENTLPSTTENIIENNVVENTIVEVTNESSTSSTVVIEDSKVKENEKTTLTPAIFTDIDTREVKYFVDQFAIGINKLNLEDTSNLESNTILLYIAQQYFSSKSSLSSSSTVDTSYASTAKNFHNFLSELTINNYSSINYLKSYNNYIGYHSPSKSYVYGKDYSTLTKEVYSCQDVTITNKENNIYTAEANVLRTYEGKETTYKITFTFKVNSNYQYQKYKLLSLKSKLTSGSVDNVVHLIGN